MYSLGAAAAVIGERLPVPHGEIPPGMPWWQAWSFDLWFLVPLGLLAWFYMAGLVRWERRTRDHPWWRTACFYTGSAILVIAMESPVNRLGSHHFSMHMLQHELAMLWAIPLMLLGAPTTPVLRGMPRWLRLGVVRRLAGQGWMRLLYRTITHPVVVIVIMTVTLWLWHFAPGWYEAAIETPWIHNVQHMSFIFAATLVWWNVIDPRPLHSRVSHLPRVLYIFAAGVPKHMIGARITFAEQPLYETYAIARPILPLTPLEDQQLAGSIMWVLSMLVTLVIMAITFFVWIHIATRRQREQEAAADRAARRLEQQTAS